MLRRWLKALAAVLLGNLVYFLLMPHLPPAARHHPERLDWGLLVDFWFCVAFFGLIDLAARKLKPIRHG
ncbi:MAG TPA: hypothetical protein VGL89_14185 [Candidatus Koribacter sp.]